MRLPRAAIFAALPLLLGAWMLDPAVSRVNLHSAENFQSINTRFGHVCIGETKRIYGVIEGYDDHAVNALIGIDLKGADGMTPIDGGGCSGAEKAPGYGVTVRINYHLGTGGSKVLVTDPRVRWYADIPVTTSKVYIEAYPKSSALSPRYGTTVHTHYGNAMRPELAVGAMGGGVSQILLPSVRCSSLSTGTISGRFFKNGKQVAGTYVSAFSETNFSRTPKGRGPFGFSNWRNDQGAKSFSIPALASGAGPGQPYTIIGRLADGESKQFYMSQFGVQLAGVRACKTALFDLHF